MLSGAMPGSGDFATKPINKQASTCHSYMNHGILKLPLLNILMFRAVMADT